MKRFSLLTLLALLSLGLFSCKKESANAMIDQTQEKLLVGKWILQQEQMTQYIDGVKRADTAINTSANNIASIAFNYDGTFSSESSYYSGGTGPGAFTSGSLSSGRYTFDGSTFGLSNSIAGLGVGAGVFGITVIGVSAPVITPVSHLSQINLLTLSKLNLHTEFVYTYSVNGTYQTYKMTDDYYYTR